MSIGRTEPSVLSRCKKFAWIQDVDQMMRNPSPLFQPQLSGSHVEAAIYLQRIAIHDLAVKPFGHAQRQFAFALSRLGPAITINGD